MRNIRQERLFIKKTGYWSEEEPGEKITCYDTYARGEQQDDISGYQTDIFCNAFYERV